MLTRRAMLTTGAAGVLVAGLGASTYAYLPGSASAQEPWRKAGQSFGDARLDALAYAILAPNPHNRQPWWFELVGEDRIDVYADTTKLLPETDPFNRQITVGFGCVLELLRMAGAEKGYDVEITPFPDGEPQPNLNGNRMAQVRFVESSSVQADPLFTSVLQRRSLKEPFDPSRPVTAETLETLLASIGGSVPIAGTIEAAERERLIDLAWKGFLIEYETDATRRESIDLMRIGNRAIAASPDGIDLGGLPMGLMKLGGVITPEALDTKGTTAYETGIDMYRDIIHSAKGFVWLKTPGNSRLDQMNAGRTWVRANLAAQSLGLGLHPLSQILQEFPEMREPYTAVHEQLQASDGETVQMLGRIGYAKFPPPSPRWPIEAKLKALPE